MYSNYSYSSQVTCFSKIQIGFTFMVPAHLGSPGKRAVKRVCVCTPRACYDNRHITCHFSVNITSTEIDSDKETFMTETNQLPWISRSHCWRFLPTFPWKANRCHLHMLEPPATNNMSSWCHWPHHLMPHLNPDWFYLSGTDLPRLSWKRGHQTGVVVVQWCKCSYSIFIHPRPADDYRPKPWPLSHSVWHRLEAPVVRVSSGQISYGHPLQHSRR